MDFVEDPMLMLWVVGIIILLVAMMPSCLFEDERWGD